MIWADPSQPSIPGGVYVHRMCPRRSSAIVFPELVVTTNRPPTKIGEESTVPGMATDLRVSVVTFAAVIPVGPRKSFRRSRVTPKSGHVEPGPSRGTVGEDATGIVSVAVLPPVVPPLEQPAASATATSATLHRLIACLHT